MGRVSQYLMKVDDVQPELDMWRDACERAEQMRDAALAAQARAEQRLDMLANYVKTVNANTENILKMVGWDG